MGARRLGQRDARVDDRPYGSVLYEAEQEPYALRRLLEWPPRSVGMLKPMTCRMPISDRTGIEGCAVSPPEAP